MQAILTIDELKIALREVLQENTPPQATTEPEQYIYGLKGLAKFLGVSITTAWHLKNTGKIPYYMAGKKLFFKRSEVLTATAKTL